MKAEILTRVAIGLAATVTVLLVGLAVAIVGWNQAAEDRDAAKLRERALFISYGEHLVAEYQGRCWHHHSPRQIDCLGAARAKAYVDVGAAASSRY